MGDLIKFRDARKRAMRRQDEQSAAANRLAHGRSKPERAAEDARAAKQRRELDAHRLDNQSSNGGDDR
jgi:hypothetical protein